MRRCEWCGDEFKPAGRGQPQRFCKSSHRVAASKARTRDLVALVTQMLDELPEEDQQIVLALVQALYRRVGGQGLRSKG